MFVSTTAGWAVIAIGGLVTVIGLALFAFLIRRKAIPLTLGLALIVLVAAAAWLFFAQGRKAGSMASWMTRSGGPHTHRIDPSFLQRDPDLKHGLDEFRQRHRDVSELVSEELRRAEIHKFKAKAIAGGYESIVITDEGSVIVLPPTPSSASERVVVPIPRQIPLTVQVPAPDYFPKPKFGRRGIIRGGLLWNLVTAISIAAFLFVGYVFLDASTRGHFTWRLRILSAMVLMGIFATMAALRLGL